MKSYIDKLMQEKNFEAIIVFGNAENNPPMTYLTGGGHVSAATLIKKINHGAVLFCNAMERDEAAKSNLDVHLYDEFPWQELLLLANGDQSLMSALRLKKILEKNGFKNYQLVDYKTSAIPGWDRYNLDKSNYGDLPRKPFSLFAEAEK